MAYKIGCDIGLDVDIVMSWPLSKIYEYLAYYLTQSPEWKEKHEQETMSPDMKAQLLRQTMMGK